MVRRQACDYKSTLEKKKAPSYRQSHIDELQHRQFYMTSALYRGAAQPNRKNSSFNVSV